MVNLRGPRITKVKQQVAPKIVHIYSENGLAIELLEWFYAP